MPAVHTGLLCPFDLGVDSVARMLNAEIADHPIYDGIELQWFDDDRHGTGMLAFLQRRADRHVDYYLDPALRLDRTAYAVGGGTGAWVETRFEVAHLEVDATGVRAEVGFTDVDGRSIEIAVDDRAAGPRRGSELLAPVGSGIDTPVSLLLVYLHGFDLVRRTATPPTIRIDGETVSTGRLPGGILHGRHLVKAAASLTVVTLCPARSGPLVPVAHEENVSLRVDPTGTRVRGLAVHDDAGDATFELSPSLPPLADLPEGTRTGGRWRVMIDGDRITGGTWHAVRWGSRVELGMAVTDRWRPPSGLPLLMRVVTRVIGVFRGWPTTYRWRAEVVFADDGGAAIESRWERVGTERGSAYRRATGS